MSGASRLCPVCHTLAPAEASACPGCAYGFPESGPGGTETGPITLPPGTLLGGRYEILALVGHGGMGMVYRASDHQLSTEVAIKLVLPALLTTPEVVSRFVTEARRARELSHDNIVRVYNLEIFDGSPVIAMELLQGRDLKARVAEGPLGIEETLELGLQVCAGLAYAHARGFVHRDIKPQNLFVAPDGHVKILDFGIAKALSDESSAGLTLATQTGVMIGTPAYMPPEQAAPKDSVGVDARADIYSLGVVLYQCLTGQLPFAGQSPVEVAIKQVTETPSPLRELLPEIPTELEQIVLKTLAKDRADRQQDMEALAADLRWFRDERLGGATNKIRDLVRPPAPPSGSYEPNAKHPRRWRAGLAALGIAGALAFAVLAGPQLVDFFGRTPRQQAASFTGIGEVNEEAGRLLPPTGDNAYGEYMKALRADSGYERAREGLDRILDTRLEQDLGSLKETAERIEAFSPGSPGADPMAESVRGDLERSEASLAKLRELFFEREEIARFASELESLGQRWNRREELHRRLAEANRLMDAGAWTTPPGNNALEVLARAELDFGDEAHSPGAEDARTRLSTELERAARASEAEGDVFAALATVTQAREVDPEDTELRAWQERLGSARDRLIAERERLESASRLVQSASGLIARGALVRPAGNNARELFELALEKDPGSAPARDGLGRVRDALLGAGRDALAAGRTEQALERFEAARGLPRWEETAAPLIAQARQTLEAQHLRQRRLEEAEAILDRAARLAGRGNLTDPADSNAADLYRRLLESHPEVSGRAREGLSRIRVKLTELARDARESDQDALELGYLNQLTGTGLATQEQGERAALLEREIAARDQDIDRSKRIQDLLELGRAQVAARRWTIPPGENAVESFRHVLAIDPENAAARSGLDEIGTRLMERGAAAEDRDDLDRALAAYRKAEELSVADAASRRVVVEERIDEARQLAEREREQETRALAERRQLRAEATELIARARAASAARDFPAALGLLEAAAEKDLSAPGLREGESDLLGELVASATGATEQGRAEEARRLLTLALRIDPAAPSVIALSQRIDRVAAARATLREGRTDLERGDEREAARALQEARGLAPDLEEVASLERALLDQLARRSAALECPEVADLESDVAAIRGIFADPRGFDRIDATIEDRDRRCKAPPAPFIPPP